MVETKRLNVHVFQAPLVNDSRVQRITKALSEANVFDSFEIVGLMRAGLPASEDIGFHRTKIRISARLLSKRAGRLGKLLGYAEWSIKVYRRYRRREIECINCHSVSLLPLSVLLKRSTNCKLVYDTHELETETAAKIWWVKQLAKLIERLSLRSIDKVFVVSDAIADWYCSEYNIERPVVVKNVPERRAGAGDTSALRSLLKLNPEDLLSIYSGGLVKSRGIEFLLEAFQYVDPRWHLVFMGGGALEDLIKQQPTYLRNVHLIPPVSPDLVSQFTSGADLGFCLIEPSCLSYRLSLPNKLFEYLGGHIPVIVNELPEQAKIVREYQCGWISPTTPVGLAALLESLNRESLQSLRTRASAAADAFPWEGEVSKLVRAYATMK